MPGFGAGSLVYLTAPNLAETSNIALAGQTFNGSPNGMPVGQYTEVPLAPASNGVYSFAVPGPGACILKVNKA